MPWITWTLYLVTTPCPPVFQFDNMYPKRFAVKNSGISCLVLIFNSNNQIKTILLAKNRFKVAKYDKSYTLYCKVKAYWLRQWVGRHGFYLWRVLKLPAAPGPFCVALTLSVHWHSFLHCCTLYDFVFLDLVSAILHWQAFTLNMNIQLPLF